MEGNSIHNVSPQKKSEIARLKAEQELKERVERILKNKLEELE